MPHNPQEDTHGSQFFKWLTKPQVGCVFAQILATNPLKSKWDGATVLNKTVGEEEVALLNRYFARATGKREAVHVLFPDINGPDEVAKLIISLCASEFWKCVEIKVECEHASKNLLVGLRWFLPDAKHVNYVLGFGDFDPMPKTRRAPFTALVLRTGPPGPAPGIAHAAGAMQKPDLRESELGCLPVHLADMQIPFEGGKIAQIWKRTGELKAGQLAGDTMAKAAKAKITFCLPAYLRQVLAPLMSEVITMPVHASAM